jgi:TRAP transporter TAXI family solute receptor
MPDHMRHARLTILIVLASLAVGPHPGAQSNGVAAKRPVFGGACPACPWGAMADVVKGALTPYGWDVQICYSCAGGPRAVRLVADGSDATPPAFVTATTLPTPQGRLDFGAVSVELLQYAYLGIHDFAKDKEGPRKQLRLLANIQTPNYFMIAVDAKSDITDLRQINDRHLPVKLLARGGINEPINAAVLDYYGLSDEKIKALGGSTAGNYTRGSDVDVVIGWAALVGAPEYALWYDAAQQHDFKYLELPPDLRAKLSKAFYVNEHEAPIALLRGVTRRIPTIARDGTAVYARTDLPEPFAYAVAKALDEQQVLLHWSHMPFSYNPRTVWKVWDVPLHPGAARYYKERGYMKSPPGLR